MSTYGHGTPQETADIIRVLLEDETNSGIQKILGIVLADCIRGSVELSLPDWENEDPSGLVSAIRAKLLNDLIDQIDLNLL